MTAKGSGSVINIGSMAGSLGLATGAAYGATKAALASLTRAWTAEYSGRGVRFNTVAAGDAHQAGTYVVAAMPVTAKVISPVPGVPDGSSRTWWRASAARRRCPATGRGAA